MRTLVPLQKNSHVDLVAATPGVEQGDSIALQNVDNVDVWVYESETPASSAQGQLVRPGEHLVTPRGTVGVFAVAMRGDSELSAGPISNFETFRVDSEPLALTEGRQFRIVRKLVIPENGEIIWKFSAFTDFQLIEQDLSSSDGDIELFIYREGQVSETAPFNNEDVPIFGKNTTSRRRKYDGAFYQRQNKVFTGGALSVPDPEQYADYNRGKTSLITALQTSVSGSENSLRILEGSSPDPVDYYLIYSNNGSGTAEGRVSVAWTEYA